MPNVMATLLAPSVQCRKVWLTPTAQVPCSNATRIRKRETWRMQSEFCTWQNSVTGQEPPKMYMKCTGPGNGQTPCKVWLASVERRRCSNEAKMRMPLKLAGVCKTNETISSASRPKFTILCKHVEEILLLNKFFPIVDTCLNWEDIARQNLCDGAQTAIFWRFFASCISSEPRAVHFRPAF